MIVAYVIGVDLAPDFPDEILQRAMSSARRPSYHGVHGKHCDVLFVQRLKVHWVNGHHLDGAPSLGRHKDHGRYPVTSREGKTLDYLFVCYNSIISRWQPTTHVLQMERSMKRHCLAASPHRH